MRAGIKIFYLTGVSIFVCRCRTICIKFQLPLTIAQPVIELAQATREAKQRLHGRRQTADVQAGKKAVVEKHASRKKMRHPKRPASDNAATKQQLDFDF